MPERCEECGSTDLEYVRAWGGTDYDPPEPAGWECLNCGWFNVDEVDEATRLGI